MLKKSYRLLCEAEKSKLHADQIPKEVIDLLQLPKSKFLKNKHVTNQKILDSTYKIYELRGDYLPARKINPFQRRPLTVIYDQHQFMSFIMPTKRENHRGAWDQEELFGIRRWRNDSPFIEEYIRVDNQIFFIMIFMSLVGVICYKNFNVKLWDVDKKWLLSQRGRFTVEDLV